MRRTRQAKGLFAFAAIFVLTGMLTLIAVGLNRSLSELRLANRFTANTQALHLAEAGLDAKLAQLLADPADDDTAAIPPDAATGGTIEPIAGQRYWVLIPEAPTITSQGFQFTVQAFGSAGGSTMSIRATVRQSGGPSIFKYAIAGKTINLDGNATIGDPAKPAPLYVEASPTIGTAALETNASNVVWADTIDFVNPANLLLSGLCPRCPPLVPYLSSTGVFRQVNGYNLQAQQFPTIKLSLTPYYEARTLHIIQATTLHNADLTGIIYVESRVPLKFTGTSHICGAIVHEGGPNGDIELVRAQGVNPSLTIDSTCGPDLVRGLAVIGAPNLHAGNNEHIDINGFVMYNGPGSNLTPEGQIRGGLVGVTEQSGNAELVNNFGPGNAGVIDWGPYSTINLGGTTSVLFDPVENELMQEGPREVKILCWQVDQAP